MNDIEMFARIRQEELVQVAELKSAVLWYFAWLDGSEVDANDFCGGELVCQVNGPETASGAEVQDTATLLPLPGSEHLFHGSHIVFSAEEELEYPVVKLRASDFFVVGGEGVCLAEDVEPSSIQMTEVLGVVLADEGDELVRTLYIYICTKKI